MSDKQLGYFFIFGFAFILVYVGWNNLSRQGYESAEYELIESDGAFQLRSYPELVLVETEMKPADENVDGSFMRLFGYISGDNKQQQKIAMTTPVFMEKSSEKQSGTMSFVLPKNQAAQAPEPINSEVRVARREGGLYAVYRFAGRLDSKRVAAAEEKLREWIEREDLKPIGNMERAGYDPPYTPGPLRRNEVLQRVEKE